MWEVAGSAMGDWEWSFPEPEGKIGTEPRRERQACEDGNPHSTTAGKEGVGPAAPNPARPPRPRASASRRRKCCVAHFRVLSGCRRRASRVSRPPPPPLTPRVPEPGATSPPWPASKAQVRSSGAEPNRVPPERPGRT
uniref:leptin receptor overlapping transcript-like 1 isoform X1 n=1 Tax=Halichoerus grypus TaxID=9711 RepID=UPI001659212A|nr:leptin receptor overlapping transcript-like 1 isoform X1 [Halichoerus grypus]